MIPSLQEALRHYEALPEEKKAIILGHTSYWLTIKWRDVVNETTPASQKDKQTIGINEIQHLLLGQMLSYLNKRPDRYSDKAILEILTDRAKNYDLLGAVQHA